MGFVGILVAIALLAAPSGQEGDPAAAKTRNLDCRDGDTVPLRVRISTPDRNLLTAVTLPDLVQNVVSAWNDRDLSVEVQGAKLFIKLLAKAEGHLDVVTSSGMHLRLFVKPVGDGQEYDGHVVLKAAPTHAEEAPRKLPDALELVKAMRLGLVPAGASVKRGADAPVFASGEIEAKLAFVYETTAYRGYVLRLTNKSPKTAYQVDLARFASPKLVLVGAKSLLALPEKSTVLYLVLWK